MENRILSLLAGAGVGAGLMYLFDPRMGRGRRAYMRDQAYGAWHEAREGFDALREDVSNRTTGLAAEARARFRSEEVSDRTLMERVRSHLGRVVSHPRAIEVAASNGTVTLRGPILAGEVDQLMCAVRSVPGVREVENRLEVFERAGNVSALQGGRERTGERWELMQDNWSPTARLLLGLTGVGLLAYGFTQDAPWACVTGSAGLGLLAAGATGGHLTEWLPESADPRSWVSEEAWESMSDSARRAASSVGDTARRAAEAVGV